MRGQSLSLLFWRDLNGCQERASHPTQVRYSIVADSGFPVASISASGFNKGTQRSLWGVCKPKTEHRAERAWPQRSSTKMEMENMRITPSRFAAAAIVLAVLTMATTVRANAQDNKCAKNITACGCTISLAGKYQVSTDIYGFQGLTLKYGCIDINASQVTLTVKGSIVGPSVNSCATPPSSALIRGAMQPRSKEDWPSAVQRFLARTPRITRAFRSESMFCQVSAMWRSTLCLMKMCADGLMGSRVKARTSPSKQWELMTTK